jgi:uncharacterized Tic20 family protein
MNTSADFSPSSDEKLMGALAHFFGPLVALVVWSTQKDKSRFVKFQALQALAFDVILILVMGVVFFCFFAVLFVAMFGSLFGVLSNASSPEAVGPIFMAPFLFPFSTFVCITPLSLLIMAIRVIAGISILNGRNYQYPVLGKWLENFLKQ